ncbi:class I SAM-dependent methyltransferase [Variovorax sp. PAMC26660]|jgi:SAM-dependent methyltransferase|uniref:class I SAM-dependent methyltransferase n=1 Tax=Variovorax sp. PAMC26660 TaxID=2762322 RepID=UPI0021C2C894|nr:class I SAM-dependent methyltransferase [Variovorax sp. PAMC26660]
MSIVEKAIRKLRMATLKWQKPSAPPALDANSIETPPDTEHADEGLVLSGACSVCGAAARFTGFTDNPRESGRCSNCQSFNRQRQMAFTIREQCGLPQRGGWHFPPDFTIYNTETTGALHLQLAELPNYVCSEYFGDEYKSGEMVDGRRHEDLQALSFADNLLDLVMTSDVMEHMPEPYAAHAEIFRVLKPGGRHIFTVPYSPLLAEDQVRAKIVDGEIIYLEEKAFHGDPVRPDEGVLVWTIFGLNMLDRLRSIGFEASEWDLDEPAYGIVGPGALTFEARKPLAA